MKTRVWLTLSVALLLGCTLSLSGVVPAHSCGYGNHGYMDPNSMGMGQMGYGQMGPGQMAYGPGGPGWQYHAPGAGSGNMARPPAGPPRPPQAAPVPGATQDHQH